MLVINVTTAPNNTSYGESGVREEEEKGGERERVGRRVKVKRYVYHNKCLPCSILFKGK